MAGNGCEEDTDIDEAHCGGRNMPCHPGETCNSGSCECGGSNACGAGEECNSGSCECGSLGMDCNGMNVCCDNGAGDGIDCRPPADCDVIPT